MSRLFLSILLGFLILLLLLACVILLRRAAYPHFRTLEDSRNRESTYVDIDQYEKLAKEDYVIDSFDGYRLHCTFVPGQNHKKIVILTHGRGYTFWGCIKYLMMFHTLGYCAIFYDNRGHGRNQKHVVTMGYLEKHDLLTVIEDTKRRYGSDCFIGLHGESMGSAISLLALAYTSSIRFVISDCGYSDLTFFYRMLVTSKVRGFRWLVLLCNPLNKLLFGYYLSSVKPMDSLYQNQVPICFIHGAKDKLVDCCNAKRMYDANLGYKELHIFYEAHHADSYRSDPLRYQAILEQFLYKVEHDIPSTHED